MIIINTPNGNKISNTVLEKEKVKNLMAYNQRIVKKVLTKIIKNLYNLYMYNCSNQRFNK